MAALSGNRGGRGFTLLETVAALVLLGIGLSVLYAGYLQAAHLEARAADAGTAVTLARAKLAQAEAGEESGSQGSCEGAPGFRWTLTREPLGDTGLARLTVAIAWEQEGPHSVKVWTLVSNGP